MMCVRWVMDGCLDLVMVDGWMCRKDSFCFGLAVSF